MKYHEALPHPRLRSFIENYWLITIDGGGGAPKEETSVPDGNSSLMFLPEHICRTGPDGQVTEGLKEQAVVVGQKTIPVAYRFDVGRRLQTFGIRFRPAGLSCFTPVPQREMQDTVVEAGQVFRYWVQETQELIALAPDISRKAEQADRFLFRNLLPQESRRGQAAWAAGQLKRCRGDACLPALAEELGLHLRSLERLFNQYIGLSPKTFSRVTRFNSAIYYRSVHPRYRLTDVAYAAGYFDQMHFIRDFKAFAGQVPKAYFRQSDRAFHACLIRLLEQRFGSS